MRETAGSGRVDDRVAVEIQGDEFPVILAQLEAIGRKSLHHGCLAGPVLDIEPLPYAFP